MSSYSINVTRVNSLNSINFTVFTEYSNASIDIPEYKIKITGVTDSTYFVVDVVEPYSDPIQLLDIRSDGEYTVPAYIGSTDIVDEKIWYRYKIVDERLTVSDIDVNIKVELVPKYPGALVSDGIDDYGIYTNIPTFSKQNGYTIIAIRKWLDTNREGCLLTRNDHNSQSTEFRFETIGVMGNQYTSSYTSILGVSYPKLLSYQTSKSYGVSKFTLQDVELQATDAMLLFAKVKNRLNAKVALYALNIYNRDLTDKEIEAEKLKMIAEYEEKTGDYSYSLVAAWSAEGKTNEDKDRNILKDISDNAYATQTQTCSLQNTIRDTGTTNTNQIIAKLDAMQNQALLDKIDALREKNSQQAVVINNAQQTAAFGQMISQATTPIVAAVNALQGDVNGIKCKLPETVTLPYSCATAVPTQAVFNGYALGAYAGWNNGCCGNSLWG